ncbi:MAG TPA: NfeD family protein [Pyrinomonadaceae bacterium]
MSILLILSGVVSAAVVGTFLFSVVVRSRRQKASAAWLCPVGRRASVVEVLNPDGAVLVGGELWRARAKGNERVECGEGNVRVVGARGCLLEVEAD